MRNLVINDISTSQHNQGITQIIQTYGRRLKDFIRVRVPNQEDAEDVLQDVYIDLTQTLRQESIEQVAAWLYRVARNKIIDRYRKHKPVLMSELNKSKGDDDDYSFIEELLGASEDSGFNSNDNDLIRDALMKALEELPNDQREVFIRHEIEQESFKSISEDLNVSVNTLLSRKHYAIRSLRKKLTNIYDEMFNDI